MTRHKTDSEASKPPASDMQRKEDGRGPRATEAAGNVRHGRIYKTPSESGRRRKSSKQTRPIMLPLLLHPRPAVPIQTHTTGRQLEPPSSYPVRSSTARIPRAAIRAVALGRAAPRVCAPEGTKSGEEKGSATLDATCPAASRPACGVTFNSNIRMFACSHGAPITNHGRTSGDHRDGPSAC